MTNEIKGKYLFDIRTGKKDSNAKSEFGEYPFFTCAKGNHKINEYSFDTEALLVAGNGAVGETKYYKGKFDAYQRTYVLDNFSNISNAMFLKYSFFGTFKKYIEDKSKGSVIEFITVKDLQNFPIWIPGLVTQGRISNYLDKKCHAIDETVDMLTKDVKNLTDYKTSLITETVCRGLGKNVRMKDSGVEWIGQIPEKWNTIKIKYYVNTRNTKRKFVLGSKYIGLENIVSKEGTHINTESEYDSKIMSTYEKNDILFGKLRPYLMKSYITKDSGYCSSEFLIIKSTLENKKILFYTLFSEKLISQFDSFAYGSKMPRVNWETIKNMSVVNHPKENEQEIVDFLDKKWNAITESINLKKNKIKLLKEYKQSLIYECVTGKKLGLK